MSPRGPLACALALAVVAACVNRPYAPAPVHELPFLDRVQQESEGPVTVRVAVPSREEADAYFGLRLSERGIQPVWIEVANLGDTRIRFAPVGMDDAYFPPFEVAYMFRDGFSSAAQKAMQEHLFELGMGRRIAPNEVRAGFVFTHIEPGTKIVNVDLYGPEVQDYTFTFFVQVPGLASTRPVNWDALYAPDEVTVVDEAGLRAALGELPAYTTKASGEGVGDPVNVALIGDIEPAYHAMVRAGWHILLREDKRVRASTRSDEHFLFGRVPDVVFRNDRERGGPRVELRVWLAPVRLGEVRVWLATIGNCGGRKGERVDPDLDEAALYLLQTIWYSQGLARYGWLWTSRASTLEEPERSFTGEPYFTSGLRPVLWLSGDPVSLLEAENVGWDQPVER